jgi:hypothetical protein
MTRTGLANELSQEFDWICETGTKPIVLCDIDGVLRFFGDSRWPGVPAVATVGSARFEYARPLVNRVRALIASGTVDWAWVTTWCDRIDLIREVWDLPGFAPHSDEPVTAAAWKFYINGPDAMVMKLTALQAAIDTGRPVVHIDDHVALGIATERFLSVRPETDAGLTPADMDAVEAFIAAHA